MDENDPRRRSYDRNSRLSDNAEIIVIIGILAEFLIDIGDKRYWEALANAVVWLGIVGTLHFGRRAKQAGDSVLADAEARIEEAQLARLKIEERLADRSVSITRADKIVAALAGHPMKVSVTWVNGDRESEKYAGQLVDALKKAGLNVFHGGALSPPSPKGVFVGPRNTHAALLIEALKGADIDAEPHDRALSFDVTGVDAAIMVHEKP